MNEYDIQSLIYICISIDNNVRMLRGKQIAGSFTKAVTKCVMVARRYG